MAKGKDARVTVILECSNCLRNGLNKESRGISRYITQKNRHNTPSLGIEKILSLLLQIYDSRGDKEINQLQVSSFYLCITLILGTKKGHILYSRDPIILDFNSLVNRIELTKKKKKPIFFLNSKLFWIGLK